MARPIKGSVVLEVVAEWFDVSIKDIQGPSRQKTLVHARWVCSHLLRKHTTKSLTQIGNLIQKDHSVVFNGCDRIERLLNEPGWQADYAEIEEAVLAQSFPEGPAS